MFQSSTFFSCAPGGGWQPARKVGGVRKNAATIHKKAACRKIAKGAATSVKQGPAPVPSSKALGAGTTQPVTGKRSRKRPSTWDNSQIPDAKKPRRIAARSSKNQGGKSVAMKQTHNTKQPVKIAAGPKKPKLTTKKQAKISTKPKTEKVKSVATRQSSRSTKC